MRLSLVLWGVLAVGVGCGDDGRGRGGRVDSGIHDSGPRNDTGMTDEDAGPDVDAGPEADAGPMDVDAGPMEMDAGPMEMDAGPMTPDAGPMTPDAGPMTPDAGPMTPDAGPMITGSTQIATARAAADGPTDIPIMDVIVTYLKPAVGIDPAGFFIQDERTGPALFVAIDPATLTPIPAVGDRVSLTVTEMATTGSLRQAVSIIGFMRLGGGADVNALVQDLSTAADVVSALDTYESELLTIRGTIAADFAGAGTGHVSAQLDTAGVAGDPGLKLRIPTALRDLLDLRRGCMVTVSATPMWRFNTQAQPSAWRTTDLAATCPAPAVTSAAASSSTQVVVGFSRTLDPASVMASGAQFSIPGLIVTGASAMGSTVTLTTSAQTSGASYTVTVASTVRDLLGTGIDPAMNSAMFTGFMIATSRVVINEVDYDQVMVDTAEFIELYNPGATPVSLAGLAVVLVNGTGMLEYRRIDLTPAGTLNGGQYLVIAAAAVTVPPGALRLDLPMASDNIQNGAPDGVALINTLTNTVLDALSYEGSITMANITGFGSTPTLVEGTPTAAADSNTMSASLSRIPNGTDTDDASADWMLAATPTPGMANIP